jgi:hypothetical protein
MIRLSCTLICGALLACSSVYRADAEEKPGADVTGAAWEHYNAARYDEGLALIAKALADAEPKAQEQATAMRGFDAKGAEWDHAAVNIAGTLWLIRGRILENQGKPAEALAAFQTSCTRYPFSQAWDPAGWFWHPGADAKKRVYKCLLRTAIQTRKLEVKFFPAKEDALDVPAQRNATSELAGDLLAKEDFAALEVLAENARKNRIRFSNGEWMLHWLYLGLETPTPVSQEEAAWEKWSERIARWREAMPRSVTARVTDAHFTIRRGWRARGSGYANTVKPEAWEKFGREIVNAEKILESTPRECPEWYQARLTVAMAQGEENGAYDRIFDRGWEAFPGYTSFVEAKAYNLLPRWHGEPGDWQRFAAEFAKENGPEYYAIAVRYASRFEGKKAFEGIDRDLLRKGWEAQIAQRPGSLALLHEYAQMLARIEDLYAGKWLSKLGDSYHADTWTSYRQLEETRAHAKKIPAR